MVLLKYHTRVDQLLALTTSCSLARCSIGISYRSAMRISSKRAKFARSYGSQLKSDFRFVLLKLPTFSSTDFAPDMDDL